MASEVCPYKGEEEPTRHTVPPVQRHVNSLAAEGVSYKRTSGWAQMAA
jgi:hypothetical protein